MTDYNFRSAEMEICPACCGAGGDNNTYTCSICDGSGGVVAQGMPPSGRDGLSGSGASAPASPVPQGCALPPSGDPK